jgi:hypothetical protein
MTMEHGQETQEAGIERRPRDFTSKYGLLTVVQGPVTHCAHARLIPSSSCFSLHIMSIYAGRLLDLYSFTTPSEPLVC